MVVFNHGCCLERFELLTCTGSDVGYLNKFCVVDLDKLCVCLSS